MLKVIGVIPIVGGVSATAIAISSRYLIGALYSQTDAIQLIEALAQSGLYLGAAIATSSATILALMLTLLALTRRADADFNFEVYQKIDRIGLMSTISLCGAMLLLLFPTLRHVIEKITPTEKV